MDYTVVEAMTRMDLIDRVKSLLNHGWEPTGGVTYASSHYMQALIRFPHKVPTKAVN